MTGIFDSGVGGLCSLYELRRLCPREDIIYLADEKNAPYGTKSAEDIRRFSEENIERLLSAGADRVLIACCTASAIWHTLPRELMEASVPIIEPAASLAAKLSSSIGVISTEATHKSGAFVGAIGRYSRVARVISAPTQALVSLVEGGCRDGEVTADDRQVIKRELTPVLDGGVDLLILGCTHFTHIRKTVEEISGIKTVSPALLGAAVVAKMAANDGEGRTVFYK